DPHEAFIGGDPGKENVVCASPLVGMFIASPNVELDGNIVGIGIGNISALHSNLDGIVIQASNVSIGNSPTRINVVANNTRHGIHLDGDVADNVTIGNCRIGVDQTNIAYGNGANGILIVDGDNNLIGTTGHNFIAANDSNGVHITGNAS